MNKTAPQANFEEFIAVFIEKTRENDTYESAYIAAEVWHKNQFGYNRFSSYESFRVRRYQQHKRRTKS